jgi:bla regulator protein blaR1
VTQIEIVDWTRLAEAISSMIMAALWQCLVIALAYGLLRHVVQSPRWRLNLGYAALIACVAAAGSHLYQSFATVASLELSGQPGGLVGIPISAHAVEQSTDPNLQVLVATLWLLGVVLQAGRFAHQWRLLRRLLRGASPAIADLQRRVAAFAQRMAVSRPIRVLVCPTTSSLLTVGWLRPVILVPASALTGIPSAHLDLLILHELAHVRRADWLLNLIQVTVETVLFFHPAIHWMSAMIRHDRELCCDDLVTSQCIPRLSYARALLSLAELEQHQPKVGNRLAMAAGDGVLMHRISRIVGQPEAGKAVSSHRVQSFGLFVLMAAGIAALSQWATMQHASSAWAMHLANLREVTRSLTPVLDDPTGLRAPAVWREQKVNDVPIAITMPSDLRPQARQVSLPEDLRWSPASQPPSLTPGQVQVHDLPVRFADKVHAAEERDRQDGDVGSASGLRPLVGPQPHYPLLARRDASEGFVQLRFRVNRAGRAVDVSVVDRGGRGVFVDASRAALNDWRFEPQERVSDWQQVHFDFSLSETVARRESRRDCQRVLGSGICWPSP